MTQKKPLSNSIRLYYRLWAYYPKDLSEFNGKKMVYYKNGEEKGGVYGVTFYCETFEKALEEVRDVYRKYFVGFKKEIIIRDKEGEVIIHKNNFHDFQ